MCVSVCIIILDTLELCFFAHYSDFIIQHTVFKCPWMPGDTAIAKFNESNLNKGKSELVS